jgi:ubiquinone/menaquinone biosynthesis C-methylase UbiE
MNNKLSLKEHGFNVSAIENPSICRILTKTIYAFPDHKKALVKSINSHVDSDYLFLENLANLIEKISNGLIERFIDSYIWMLDVFLEEQLEFVRTNKYRRMSFQEVYKDIYSDKEYMRKYMEGLLLSQLLWVNHAKSYVHFHKFMLNQSRKFHYLEIGPGHGMYLLIASSNAKCITSEAWDVSAESLRQTKSALQKFSMENSVKLLKKNLVDELTETSNKQYDLIVISEVLEHIEEVDKALINIYEILSENGTLYLNFPVNSPAPDHIYLLRTIEDVEKLLINFGFKITSSVGFPSSNYTLDEAKLNGSAISCIVTAKKN